MLVKRLCWFNRFNIEWDGMVVHMNRWERRLSGVGLLVMGVVCCLQTGAFFASDLYKVVLGISMISLVLGMSLLTRSNKIGENTTKFSHIWILLCPFFIMILYVIHRLSEPLSAQGTTVELLKWGWLGTFAVIAYAVGSKKEGRTLLQVGWHGMGLLLSLSAIFDIYGLVRIPFNIVFTSNPEISATGARLAGMIQYPNTFGAIMAAFLLERLFALAPLMKQRPTNTRVLLGILPIAPYAAALLLSESRGAWVAAGVAAAAGFVLERRSLVPPLVLAAAPCLSAALLYRQLAQVQLAPVLWPSLWWLAGLWAGSALAGLGLSRLVHGRARIFSTSHRREFLFNSHLSHPRTRRIMMMFVAVVLWIASCVTVWLTVNERLTTNYGTVSARWVIYRDAWRLVQQAPWLGQGGYTWRMSYASIQSQPYVGSEVHSGYLDLLLNTGMIGFMIMVFMLIGIGWMLYKQQRTLVPTYLVFVLHAAVDFDWSFGLVWLLIFWLAAWGFSHRNHAHQGVTLTASDTDISVPYVESLSTRYRLNIIMPKAICMIWLCTTLGLTGLSLRGEMSSILQKQALQAQDSESSQRLLRSSLRWNPMNTDATLQFVQISTPKEAIPVLTQSLSYSPQHPGLVWKLAYAYGELGESESYIKWLSKSILLDPYNTDKQSHSLEKLLTLSLDQLSRGDRDESDRLVRIGVSQYNDYKDKVEELVRHQEQLHNDRQFLLTKEAKKWGSQLDMLAQSLPDS